jgi:hypothetical protein
VPRPVKAIGALSERERDIRLDFGMGKYLTRRCIGLHVVTLLFVSSCLFAAWWQYESARGGNGLSWAYVFEWPAFAVYAAYMWWKLIHDQRTAFDRLWTAKQHAAADAFGTPLHQIPGWALDKTLSRAVVAASIEAADSPLLSLGRTDPPELGDGESLECGAFPREPVEDGAEHEPYDRPAPIIDAQVFDVKVVVDEPLNAYNRYLAELNRQDLPKHWGVGRNWVRGGAAKQSEIPVPPSSESGERQRSELPVGDRPPSD